MEKIEKELADAKRNSVPIPEERIGTRINEVSRDIKGGKKALAQASGLSEAQLYRIIAGSEPRMSTVIAIAELCGVSLEWLATGKGPKRQDEQPQHLSALGGDYAAVPLYDVTASAGPGLYASDEPELDKLIFKRQWIHDELHASPADLYLMYVEGDSMEDVLRAGDVILVNRRDARMIPHDDIYVLRIGDSVLVKRVQRLPGKRILVSSQNDAYSPFEVPMDAIGEDVDVIGRVVWLGRRL